MITLENISFAYRKGVPVLIDASAQIMPGINLLLGPNGAGKTTLLKILATTLRPATGSYTMDGSCMDKRTVADLERIFMLAEDEMYPLATINDMVVRHACFYPSFSISALRANLAAYGMSGDEKLSEMSLGQRKKANVAYALALGTELLLLDEPANGMDIGSKKIFNQLLASNCRDNQTIIIATHTVHDMKNLFDGVIMLNQGHIELSASVEEVTSKLAFVTTSSLPANALYSEPDLQGYKAIVINNQEQAETSIDYVLLYSSLLSHQGEEIARIVNGGEGPQADLLQGGGEGSLASLEKKGWWSKTWMLFQYYWPGLRKQVILMPLAAVLITAGVSWYLSLGFGTDNVMLPLSAVSIMYYLAPIGLAHKNYRSTSATLPVTAGQKLTFLLLYFWIFVMLITTGVMWLTAFIMIPFSPEIWTEIQRATAGFTTTYGMSPFAPWVWPLAFFFQTIVLYAVLKAKRGRQMKGIVVFLPL